MNEINNNTHLCHECSFQCETAKHLHNHLQTHDFMSFFCQDCGKSFTGIKQYNNHWWSHKTFHCEVCEKDISVKNRVRHVKLCTGLVEPKVKIYECDVCDYSTGRKDTLVRHKSSQHTKFICEVCGFQFDSKAKLRRGTCS